MVCAALVVGLGVLLLVVTAPSAVGSTLLLSFRSLANCLFVLVVLVGLDFPSSVSLILERQVHVLLLAVLAPLPSVLSSSLSINDLPLVAVTATIALPVGQARVWAHIVALLDRRVI